MSFAGINYLGVLLAAIASFLFGGVWYSAFSQRSLADAGEPKTRHARVRLNVDTLPFIVAFVALLLMAYVLAGAIGHLGLGQVTVRNGIISALFVWAGFVMTALVINHMVHRLSRTATLVDGAHWLGVLLIQGAVIGWIGV
jgi:hypothetical protein